MLLGMSTVSSTPLIQLEKLTSFNKEINYTKHYVISILWP